jgi:hypothetical protein
MLRFKSKKNTSSYFSFFFYVFYCVYVVQNICQCYSDKTELTK